MKNHVVYRIACTLQLLVLFFFLATMSVDPQAVMRKKGFRTAVWRTMTKFQGTVPFL